ncbi:MAG: response regulator [Bacteroidota bacterium]
MPPTVLLVDDQRSILHLLHEALDRMGHELDILESPSGEEALLFATRRPIDLLVVDYRLPGINGIELIHKIRARHPGVKVIIITGVMDRRSREAMLNAGALAVFDKPIPIRDFMDAVEQSLGLSRASFPPAAGDPSADRQNRVSELLANFRQDIDALAVFLVSDRGLILARAGDLPDSSMEPSLISAIMAVQAADLKISRFIHQKQPETYHVFPGGDQDLILIPVDPSYSLLVAGRGLAERARLIEMLQSVMALREKVADALTRLGMTGALAMEESPAALPAGGGRLKAEQPAASPELEDLLNQAGTAKPGAEEIDHFWDQAAEKHTKAASDPDVISYEQARKLGLVPGEEK